MSLDTYCQSMQADIDKGLCNECGLYWPSGAAKDHPSKAHTKGKIKVITDIFEFDQVVDEFDSENKAVDEEKDIGFSPMPVFEDVRSHLASPFVIITDAIAE